MTFQQRIESILALPDETKFYIQSYGYVGNCLNLWQKESKGYTTDIDNAKQFTKQEVIDHLNSCEREQDVVWEADELLRAVKRTVSIEDVDKEKRYRAEATK